MPSLITALTRSAIETTTRENNKQKDKQKQKFHGRNPLSKIQST